MGEIDIDHQGLALRIDPALLGKNLLWSQRTGEDVSSLIGLQDVFELRRGEALRDAFDDVGATHHLDSGEEVVVRNNLEVIIGGGGTTVDGRGEAENLEATGGPVFRDGVKGVEE